jgi:Mn2+/Fe2+ NRAMP family transporter
MPLIGVLVLTQVLNAILLLPLLVFTYRLAHDPQVMGRYSVGGDLPPSVVIIGLIASCLAGLAILTAR